MNGKSRHNWNRKLIRSCDSFTFARVKSTELNIAYKRTAKHPKGAYHCTTVCVYYYRRQSPVQAHSCAHARACRIWDDDDVYSILFCRWAGSLSTYFTYYFTSKPLISPLFSLFSPSFYIVFIAGVAVWMCHFLVLLPSISFSAVPPDEPRVFDTHGKEITTVAGPFREGQEFFLSCQVSGGKPTPKVSWWRNDVEIPGTTHQSIATGAIINNILMRSVPRTYFGTKILCRAQGSQLIKPVEKEITVQLHCE